jgi:hypothetical protein
MIRVDDNVFSKAYTGFLWAFVKASLFQLGWKDSGSIEHSSLLCMHSQYSPDDLKDARLLEELSKTDIGKLVNTDKLTKCIVNLVTPGQTYIEHTHLDEDVLLIYCNEIWRREWGGETLFYSKDNVDLERAVEYIPNRVVFFSGEHPHTIRPPSFSASNYRFTVTLFFEREKLN